MGIARAVIFSRRVRLLAFLAAALGAFPIVGDPRDARARNLEMLDAIVFVLGVGILGGVLVWWGLRIYREK
jgi:nitric oxide reductase large subunit